MKRLMVAVALVPLLATACSSGGGYNDSPASTVSRSSATGSKADADLILTMYSDITSAFQRKPDDGVRALVAAQYPGDRADVNFARCVSAILPGAKTLPSSKKVHFVPNILTMTPDSGYSLTSYRVKGLRPKGRIYVTDVTITDGGRPTVRQRHQVVLDGKAYQFSTC
jgi:hypothetical protein